MNLLTTNTLTPTHLSLDPVQTFYIIPMTWYIKYVKYKKGGPPPGPILIAPLLTPTQELDPNLQETLDYRTVTATQWIQYSKTFGNDREIRISKRPIVRSVSSGGYEDDAFSNLSFRSSSPATARKPFEFSSEISSEVNSKPASLDKEHPLTLTPNSITPKLGLSVYENSSGFNACLQLLMSIEELVDFIVKVSAFGDCYNSEFLLQIALVFIAGLHVCSGVINAEMFFKGFKFCDGDPGHVVQMLINKLEVETSNSSSVTSFLDGVIKKEIQCLVCTNSHVYDTKFSYLALKPSKSLNKSFERFSRHMTQSHYCPDCLKENDCYIRMNVAQFPLYFVVILKWWEEKSDKHPCSFKAKWNPGVEYRLISVVSEVNKSFVNFSKRKKNWFVYEGEDCKKALLNNVLSSFAYVLLYKLAS